MADFLRLIEAKAVAEALRARGYKVSDRTVQRWKSGAEPRPQDMNAIRELFGVYEKSPPAWAEGLITEMASIRSLVEGTAAQRAALVAALEATRRPPGPSHDDPRDDRLPPRIDDRLGQ